MATQVQWRGGSTAEHSTFTGAAREVTVDTQKKTLVVHDGSTAGGEPLLREDQANLPSSVTNGISVPSANNVAISTNGTQALYINADGDILVADGNRMEIDEIRARDGAGLKLYDDAGSGIFVKDGGNVGIGTTSPVSKLHIVGANEEKFLHLSTGNTPGDTYAVVRGDNEAGIRIDGGGSYRGGGIELSGGQRNSDPGLIKFFTGTSTNPSEAARIDSSGRLLVGTFSAVGNQLLQVVGIAGSPTNYAGISLRREHTPLSSLGSTSPIGIVNFEYADGGAGAQIGAYCDVANGAGTDDYPTRLVFSTTADGDSSPTQRLYISSEGYVVPGASAIVDLSGAQCGPGLKSPAATVVSDAKIEGVAGSAATRYMAAFSNPNGIVGSISTSGSATAYTTSSDYRLKENVTPVADGITRLQQLKPSRFNFIADPDKMVDGFLAHEVQDIVPEAITGEKDAVDDEGNPQYQGIDQSKIVPLLTAALQEAVAKIESIEARLTAAGL